MASRKAAFELIDVDIVALVRAGADLFELHLRFGEPGPEMRDDITDSPGRIDVVAGLEALLRRQAPDQRHELIPAVSFSSDLA